MKPNAACKKANDNCNILNFNHDVFTSKLDVIHTIRQSHDDFQRLYRAHIDTNADTNTNSNANTDTYFHSITNTYSNPISISNSNTSSYT